MDLTHFGLVLKFNGRRKKMTVKTEVVIVRSHWKGTSSGLTGTKHGHGKEVTGKPLVYHLYLSPTVNVH